MLLLLLAALSQPIDPRITHPWELTVTLTTPAKTASHTETYRTLELCRDEQRTLVEALGGIPQVTITPCNYIGLT